MEAKSHVDGTKLRHSALKAALALRPPLHKKDCLKAASSPRMEWKAHPALRGQADARALKDMAPGFTERMFSLLDAS